MLIQRCIILLITLLISGLSIAQDKIYVTGTVLDNESGSPLEYATIVLQSVENPQKINGGITNSEGVFKIEAVPGDYNIRVEFISFATFTLENKNISENIDLGVIKLKPDAAQLDELVIIAETTTVDIRLDKKIYNVGKDLTNSGATISEALSNIPSVTVDLDGTVALRGNNNVRILINGRPSALAGFGSTDALQQLPADAIERIEVITSPSARYDAEGTAGILNIILRKEKTRGFNGTFNARVGTPAAAGLSANLNWRKDKFNLFSSLGYSYQEPPGNGFFDNTFVNGTFDRIIEDRDINRKSNRFNANLGLEYFINDNSSLTASIFGRTNEGEDVTSSTTERFINTQLDSRTFRIEDEGEEEKSYQVSLNYNNDFNDEGHKLTADFQYSFNDEAKPTFITENNTFPNTTLIADEIIQEEEIQNEFLLQADYVLPMGEAQFEAGYRGNWQQTDTDFSLEERDLDTGVFVPNLGLTNTFFFTQNVNAVYTQYGDKIGKLSFLAGLRLENTTLTGRVSGVDTAALEEILGTGIDLDFDKNYLGLFPTLNLTYELADGENLTLGYNRRINRPRGYFINPFPSRASRTNINQGNPDLDPSFANAFDLGYIKEWDKLTLTSSIFYQRETGSFERIQEETGQLTNDGIVIIRTLPINLSTNQRIGAELAALYNPYKWWRLNASFNFFQFTTEGIFNEVDFGARNTSWFSRISSKVNLPWDVEWQTNANYRGPTENAQTRNKGIFSMDIAFSKDLLNDNATISLNARDLLNSRKRMSFTQTQFFTSQSEFQWRERQITLSFVYRINQKKQQQRGGDRDDSGGEDY